MNLSLKKFVSKITAAAMAVSMFTGVVIAEADTAAVYEFKASEEVKAAPKTYGFDYDNTRIIWTPDFHDETKADSVYYPAVRFTARNLNSLTKELVKHTLAKDTVNNPNADTFTDKKYTYESEFAPLYYNTGYLQLNLLGKDASGNEQAFAEMRIKYSNANKGIVNFVDAEGKDFADAMEFEMNNMAANGNKAGKPATVVYLRADVDFENNTFTAWLIPRKVKEGAYTATPVSDEYLLAKDAPMLVSGIGEFVGMSVAATESVSTNGIWIHDMRLTPVSDEPTEPTATPTESSAPTAEPTAAPTAAPTVVPTATPIPAPGDPVLIDEENFSDKTVSDGKVDGWEYYDKDEKVDKFSNFNLTISNNKLQTRKTSIMSDESDYSERFRSMYRFRETFDKTENTETYTTGFEGKYRIETNARVHIESGSQFQVIAPAMGESLPTRAFAMCINNSKVYEYISSSEQPTIYSGSITDKDTTIIYDVDTEAGTIKTTIGDQSYDKKVTPAPLQGIMYIIKSKAAANDYVTVNNIKLYRMGGESTVNEAAEEAKKLTIDMLTSTPNEVSTNLKALPSRIGDAYVSWSSSNPNIIDVNGKLLDQPLEGTVDVTMTAVIAKGDDTVNKDFKLKVTALDQNAFILMDDVDLTNADNVKITDGGASHNFENGKLNLVRTSNSQTPYVDIYPNWGGKQFKAVGTWVAEVKVDMPQNYQKAEIVMYDSKGARINSFYTTHASAASIVTGVGRTTAGGDAVHTELPSGKSGAIPVRIKAMFNTDTQRMSLYASFDGTDNYVTVLDNGYTREEAVDLAYIRITANNDNNQGNPSLFGTLSVEDVNIYTLESEKLKTALYSMGYYSPVENLGGYIRSDIDLVTNAYAGTTVEWTSSNPDILSNDGKLNTEAYTTDTPISLNFKLSLDGTDQVIERTFDLTAIYIDKSNLAIDKNADCGKIQPMTGHGPKKAVDGSMGSYWQTMRFEDLPYLRVDLGREEVIEDVTLYEASMMDTYPIKGYVIETSRDGNKWTQAASGTTLGEEAVNITINSVIARYVRFRVTSKDDGYCCGLREFMIYSGRDDKTTAGDDIVLALDRIGSLTDMTQDKTLPTAMQYGSKLSYESSIPTSFSNTGVVTQGTSKVSGTLTITAELNGEKVTKTVPISVAKKSTSINGGNGSSSGNKGNGGGSSYVTPANPVVINPTPKPVESDTTFNDVKKDNWAFDYIEDLAAKGVVSGDVDKNFRPNDNISRQEFVKILLSAFKVDLEGAPNPNFNDVSNKDWSYDYIAKAVQLGIINGVSEDEFAKNSNITRQDMAVMCVRALKSLNMYEDVTGESFADGYEIADYAAEAVSAMSGMSVINGYNDNTFRPHNNATRAEAAKIIYMLIK